MLLWLLENKNWVFDGIGVAIIGAIFEIIRRVFCSRKGLMKSQHQKSGKNSINLQNSGTMTFCTEDKNKND